MPTAKEFAREVEALALTVTGYQERKSGQNGLCDCIGLIIGAMTRLGHGSYPMHSTNYFARYEMTGIRPMSGPLSVGQVVYKARDDQSDLDERYKHGGRYYRKGNLLDYYHVGVVTDTAPLEITHCTQDGSISGIKRDSSTKGWTHVGEVKGVDYATDINVGRNEEEIMSKPACVIVPDGTTTANMRERPNKKAKLIKRITKGTVVNVVEVGTADGQRWATIIAPDGKRGYMMETYLKYLEYADDLPTPDGAEMPEEQEEAIVTLTLPESAARAIYDALSEVFG